MSDRLQFPFINVNRRLFMDRGAGVGDELLDMLGNYLDLRPIYDHALRPKKSSLAGGASRFYNRHFPLLLEKKKFHEEESTENKVVGRSFFDS